MTIDLGRAMRAASALTRSQDLVGATKVIQQALSRVRAAAPPQAGEGEVSAPTQDNQARTGQHLPPLSADTRLLDRLRVPLGDVVKALRRANLKPAWGNKIGGTNRAALPEGAQFVLQTFGGPAGNREYKLYLPSSKGSNPPLLVMLHGCTQDADDFAAGTRMNKLAEEFGFLVAYPIQPRGQNPSGCWNWFRPNDQRRALGEPSIIAGIADQVAEQYDVDPRRVFVAGLSAGGAMAAVMAATYPDKFAGVGIHSGLSYGAANDVMSAFAAMRGEIGPAKTGAAPSSVPTIVFHGDADQTVNPVNADHIVNATSAGRAHSTDTSIGEASGRRFTRRVSQADEASIRFENWRIHGAGHAWSGGSADGTFADEAGPDASREMVRFFRLTEPR